MAALILTLSPAAAAPGDADNDGLRDEVETNTGVFVSATNTGTNPSIADSDGDSLPDGIEVTQGTNPTNPSSRIRRPNIIYIVADDMGYGDVGCFWQNQRTGPMKFATPGLDMMASQGAMLTNHYVAASICAPSRCSFLQGRSQGHASIRDLQFDSPLPGGYNTASILKAAGYRTIHIGKAGLAGRDANNPAAHPLDRGFDRFFGYLLHGHAHEHYPRNGLGKNGAMICNDRTFITDGYQDLFSADAFTAFAKKTIIDSTAQDPNKPFFIYLAYDTPHFDNQYPPTATYPAGGGLSGGLQWTGSPSYVNTAINDPTRINNPANRHPSVPSNWGADSQPFVSMVRRLDDSVADILQTLRDLGVDQNTLVVFTTDNGPEPIGIYPPNFESYGPFEGIKGDLLEGGIRVPTIAWWPGTLQASNQPTNIRKIDRPSANYDWLSTFAELALCPAPGFADATSLAPTLTASGSQQDKGFLYFELNSSGNTANYNEFVNHRNRPRNNMQAIRIGNFMGLRTAITSPDSPFMIFDVVNDPKQSVNLASSRPDLQQEMRRLSVGARRPVSTTTRPYDNTPIPAFQPSSPVKPGLKWKSYEGYWPWLPDFRTLVPAAAGESAGITPSVRSRNMDVGLLFEGYLSIAAAGAYTFQVVASAESSLWFHESNLIDNDFAYQPVRTSGTVQLSAGLHPIRLFFRHRSGTPSLELRYSGPGIAMQPVPAAVLMQDGQPTVLSPDSFTVARGTNVLLDVLANDTAEVPLVLSGAGSPRFGTSSVSSGRVSYTPNPGFIGLEGFSYQASDGLSARSAEVSGTVLYENEVWFPLDEGSGVLVRQAGGPASGTLAAADTALSWVAGRTGRGLRFRGNADRVTFHQAVLPAGKAPRTFSAWVRSSSITSNSNQALFSQGSGGIGQRFTVRLAPVSPGSTVHGVRLETEGGIYSGIRRVNDGQWHHVCVSVADRNNDGSVTIDETRIHIDGVEDTGLVDAAGIILTSTAGAPPSLGGSAHDASYDFYGDLDDIRFFTRALGNSDIQFLASNPPQAANYGQSIIVTPDDDDDDGYGNLSELAAGTDPDDSGSFPRIQSIQPEAGGFRLTWNGIEGRTYRVMESTNLKDWVPAPGVAPIIVESASSHTSVLIPQGTGRARFYRLAIELTNP